MPKKLQKSLQDYLSKIKKPTTQLCLQSKTLSSSTSWILRGCKHPKTPSIAVNVKQNEAHETTDAATLSDVDRFLFENFSSLYQEENDDDDDDDDKGKKGDKDNNNGEIPGSLLFDSPRFLDLPVDFRGSQRFFIQRSSSGSIVEEARTSMTTSEDMAYSSTTSTPVNDSKRTNDSDDDDEDDDDANDAMDGDDFITLLTYSPDPYDDFRQSMHEMIEARLHFHGKVDWEFMEELLFRYLNLNDKKSYKFILNAFVGLVVFYVTIQAEFQRSRGTFDAKERGGRKGRCTVTIKS